jgi:hypothetical protein
MKVRAGHKLAMVVVGAVMLFAALPGRAQFVSQPGGVLGHLPGTRPQNDVDGAIETNPPWGQQRMHALNVERHKSVVSDSDKLLKLARQLDAEIASNPTEELTPQELQKVAEIEKLAHNVKTKMAQSFGGGPPLRPLPVPNSGLGPQ